MSLPWIKHFTNVSDSDVVSQIIDELGMVGYGRYWRLLELLGKRFDENTTKFKITKRDLREAMRFSNDTQLHAFMVALATHSAVTGNPKGRHYELESSIISDLQHRDFKRARRDRAKTKTKTNTNTNKKAPPEIAAIDPRIIEIIDYLNQKQACNYGPQTKSHHVEIKRQLKKGMTVDDAKLVIDAKCEEWDGGKLEKNLNPTTLFRESNFDKYLDQSKTKNPKERLEDQMKELWGDPNEGGC
ncbi:MAG: conserved phage C-terminal domain-containing protein [Pseudoalteromonas sp.]